jgi:hypothetical protein
MSAQGLNARDYSGMKVPEQNGSPAGFPLRDSSDYTRMLKNRSLYTFYKGKAILPLTIQKTAYTDPQSNEQRLNYQFGVMNCDAGCESFPKVQLGGSD